MKRASFSNDWVRSRILMPGLFDGLRLELRVIIYLLIETGARLSELVNLRSEQSRELRTGDSRREIPLVGVRPMLKAPRATVWPARRPILARYTASSAPADC